MLTFLIRIAFDVLTTNYYLIRRMVNSNGSNFSLSSYKTCTSPVKLSYEDRLGQLGLTTLETRRRNLIETYKITSGRENFDKYQFFRLSTSGYGLRGHSLKLAVSRCLNVRKYNSFSQRVVADWNRLPDHVMAPSVNAFNNRLDKHWSDMGI